MKLMRWFVPTLACACLMIGCGNRQQAHTVGQQVNQPLVGESSAALQQAQSGPQAPPAYPADQTVYGSSQPRGNGVSKPSPYASKAPSQPPVSARYQESPDAHTRVEVGSSTISIPAGTRFEVRLEETIDTKRNQPGDHFDATLANAIVVDQQTLVPRGTRFRGHLIESRPSGRLKGHAELSLSLDSFELNGSRYDIKTTHVARASGGHKKRNWFLIGGGSGLGTTLGAIAGGPAGALIGAGAGAGAGTAGAVFTGKKNVRLPVETELAFTLRQSVALAN